MGNFYHEDYSTTEARRKFCEYQKLYIAILGSQWEAAQEVIDDDRTVLRAFISEGRETALHLAASAKDVHFVKKLVAKMDPKELESLNAKGNTALCFAAACGNTKIAKIMIQKNKRLPNIYGSDGVKPISVAALQGHRKMVEYLLPLTEVKDWSDQEEQANLLTTCITSGLYGKYFIIHLFTFVIYMF